jgi:hypothetical protein
LLSIDGAQGVLATIGERVRFGRRRFGHYEVVDFLAVLFGYALSGERTLEAFYERVRPFAVPHVRVVWAGSVASPLGPLALFECVDIGTC